MDRDRLERMALLVVRRAWELRLGEGAVKKVLSATRNGTVQAPALHHARFRKDMAANDPIG